MNTSRRAYRSDLSDARWAWIEPILTAWRDARPGLGISQPKHDLREIINAIFYVNRTGIAWEYLPHDFPSYKTVYDYYAKWEADGTTEAIHNALREQVRAASGRKRQPSAAIIDSQSVKTSTNVPESSQGIDAHKKIVGRKRHIVTDILGLILAVIVTAASVPDTVAARALIGQVATSYPHIRKIWVDGGYQRSAIETGAAHGIDVEVVSKTLDQQGFHPLPKRWIIERTNGWLMTHRRLARDYETLPQRSRTHIHWAMIDNMSRRLTKESTPTWRDYPPQPDIPL
jgi:transposase